MSDHFWAHALSQLLGWSYFTCWSLSFFPQPYIHWRDKSVRGLSMDFLWLSWTGFVCYAGFNISLLAVPGIRRQFTERYHAPPSSVVHASDLIFTVLGVVSLVLQLVQAYCLGYARDPLEQRVSTATRGFIFACGVYVVGTLWLTQLSVQLQMLDVVYSLSTVKLAATFPKMLSQVLYNYRRRSTRGWSLHNILLDVSGGVLSMIQLLVDAYIAGNLGLAFRNPVKLGLGLLSILFDAIFIAQHVAYGDREPVAYQPVPG